MKLKVSKYFSVLFLFLLFSLFLFVFSNRFADSSFSSRKNYFEYLSGSYAFSKDYQISNKNVSPSLSVLLDKYFTPLDGVVDAHTHLVLGASKNSKAYLNPILFSPSKNLILYFKSNIFLTALGATNILDGDFRIKERLDKLINFFPLISYKALIFAFSAVYDKNGHKNLAETTFEVPNALVIDYVASHKNMIAVGSIHPFQKNLEEEFENLVKNKVFFVKVLPNSMGFDPADEACDAFYSSLSKHNMILITHVGDEHSVGVGNIKNEYGNPLLYEKWLKKYPNLRIVFAHMGSKGQAIDAHSRNSYNFDLVIDLMLRYPKQTWADISAFACAFMRAKYLPQLILRKDIHNRLLYGSDYPVNSILPMVKLTLLNFKRLGLLDEVEDFFTFVKNVEELYHYNPFAVSLLLMRIISFNGEKFPLSVFAKNFEGLSPF